jgi:hypothetical protein
MMVDQVGKKWTKYWPKLLDDAYLASLCVPDDLDPSNLNEEWRRYLRVGEFAMVRFSLWSLSYSVSPNNIPFCRERMNPSMWTNS